MLIVTCVALTVLLGFAALGIDLGRMYVIQSELQAFSDAAALAAATELDGTPAGIERARLAPSKVAGGAHAMKWDMGTKPIDQVAASFAAGDAAPDANTWSDAPKDTRAIHFVRVTASAPAPLVFMRIFQQRESSVVAAASLAAKWGASARLIQ